jgi:DNA repair photolyase
MKKEPNAAVTPASPFSPTGNSVVDIWNHTPVTINRNNFIYKSLSCWSVNQVVGCGHGCLFCSVPSTSANKLGEELKAYGVLDPDEEWGRYVLLRPWSEKRFLRSLQAAERIPLDELNRDGNRAVMISTTTDPYQVFRHPDPERQRQLFDFSRRVIRRLLELIRDESSLNVRLLTRSPLATQDFDLFQSFGKRLVFGMSLPTLRNDLAASYEPHAPAPARRLAALKAAKAAGLHVYVAIAPTFPECDYPDLRATMKAVAELEPITIFAEPINIRAENVTRIEAAARLQGITLAPGIFTTRTTWRNYARTSLEMVWQLGAELEIQSRLHLWPDANLGSDVALREVSDPYAHLAWLKQRWNRISEWPR